MNVPSIDVIMDGVVRIGTDLAAVDRLHWEQRMIELRPDIVQQFGYELGRQVFCAACIYAYYKARERSIEELKATLLKIKADLTKLTKTLAF
jgi:hypothetical protein